MTRAQRCVFRVIAWTLIVLSLPLAFVLLVVCLSAATASATATVLKESL